MSLSEDLFSVILDKMYKSSESFEWIKLMRVNRAFSQAGYGIIRNKLQGLTLERKENQKETTVTWTEKESTSSVRNTVDDTLLSKSIRFFLDCGAKIELLNIAFFCHSKGDETLSTLSEAETITDLTMNGDCCCETCGSLVNRRIRVLNNCSPSGLLALPKDIRLEKLSIAVRTLPAASQLLREREMEGAYDFEVTQRLQDLFWNGAKCEKLILLNSDCHVVNRRIFTNLIQGLGVCSLLLLPTLSSPLTKWDLAFATSRGNLMGPVEYWLNNQGEKRIAVDSLHLVSCEQVVTEAALMKLLGQLHRMFDSTIPSTVEFREIHSSQQLRLILEDLRRVFVRDFGSNTVHLKLSCRLAQGVSQEELSADAFIRAFCGDFSRSVHSSYLKYGYDEVHVKLLEELDVYSIQFEIEGFNKIIFLTIDMINSQ